MGRDTLSKWMYNYGYKILVTTVLGVLCKVAYTADSCLHERLEKLESKAESVIRAQDDIRYLREKIDDVATDVKDIQRRMQ